MQAFPQFSSPEGSKFRAQYLLDAIIGTTTPYSLDCLNELTHFVCFLLSGRADRRIAPWFCGAPLTALYKKQGGIRPIAGETLHHLIGRVCRMAVKPQLPDMLLPVGQVGVGIPVGLEAAIHSFASLINEHGQDPSLCCVKIDLSNAFNKCSHLSFLNRV